jgi:hypothetical protein
MTDEYRTPGAGNLDTRQLAKQARAAGKALAAAQRLSEKESAKRERRVAKAGKAAPERLAADAAQRLAQVENHLAQLRSSYYLSGARKKIDIRDIEPFGDIVRTVTADGRLGMDYDRLYTLWQAAMSGPPSVPVIEIGVYKGGSAKFIAECLRRAERSPDFFVCDTFEGHPRVHADFDTVHRASGKFVDTSAADVTDYLRDYANVRVIEGDIYDTAERLAHIPAWGFVHVDVDVYPATDFCLQFFVPRLLPGAWLVVDDYGFVTCPGVKKAVDDFVRQHKEVRALHLLTGQAVIHRFC